MSQHTQAHTSGEEHIPGITHDPVLRPVGTLMAIVGTIWALFWGMAAGSGTYGQTKAAAALIVVGLLLTSVGKRGEQT